MDIRRKFGNAGEELAEQYLKDKGFIILERQFLTRLGEIDLVALDEQELVFVEVKSRKSAVFGFPEEAVTRQKLQKIIKAAELYLRKNQLVGRSYRIDVISILFGRGTPDVLHLVGVG